MLIPVYTTRFEKDLKRMRKRGCDVSKIKAAIISLINEKPLDARMKDQLRGIIPRLDGITIEPYWLLFAV